MQKQIKLIVLPKQNHLWASFHSCDQKFVTPRLNEISIMIGSGKPNTPSSPEMPGVQVLL